MIKNILKSIKLARLDSIKTVEVDMDDMVTLSRHIAELEQAVKEQKKLLVAKDTAMVQLQLRELDRPIRLDVYG